MAILEGLLGLVVAAVAAWFKLVADASVALICLVTGDTATSKDVVEKMVKRIDD